jgi:isopenicillin-N epimerase
VDQTHVTIPPLGTAIRGSFSLDPDWLTVNHGSYGAVPREVQAVQAAYRERMESQPLRFLHIELPPLLRAAAGRLAETLGGRGEDLAFVENATQGCNAVLRSIRFERADEIIVLDHGYPAVIKTARYIAERTGARVVEVALPFPRPDADALTETFRAALTERTRLVILDHITSPSALVLPIARLAALAHAAGARVLIDGAHGPGNVAVELPATGADWYVGNCHKWLMAPKGAGFVWTTPAAQEDLHPVTISHGYGKGFLAEFDWTGTRDASAQLAVPAALSFLERLGGTALMARNAALADAGAALVAERLGVQDEQAPGMTASMRLVRLPVAGPATLEHAEAIRTKLLAARTDAPPIAVGSAIWVRISAHAYNELADYDRLGGILAGVIAKS